MAKAIPLFFLATAMYVCSSASADAVEDAAAIFDSFKSLVGTYREVDTDGRPATVKYALTAGGSAMTETWYMPSGKQELTVFHMDNGSMVATHYCAANRQSTVVLSVPKEGELDYPFRLRSISNLPSSEASHNTGFAYRFASPERIERTEEWLIDGQASSSSLTLIRVKEPRTDK